ncbi:MAG TPA: amino acid ABC transporter permease [Aggregatilineales bacterium]|nr:amino acid ABC transporter permease [Aggregatilineales bacterium]
MTQAEVLVRLPGEDYDAAGLTCAAGAGDACGVGASVSVLRTKIEGYLLLEDLGKYQLRLADGTTVDVRKFTVDQAAIQRTPENCIANPNATCFAQLPLLPGAAENRLSGTVTESIGGTLVIQTVPPIIETLPRTGIARTLRYIPGQCALNNLSGCNEGIFLTLGVTLVAFVFACLLGLGVGLMRISKNPILYHFSTVYVEVMRGIPMLVIILLVGFAIRPWLRDEFPLTVGRIQLGVGILAAIFIALTAYRNLPLFKVYPGEILRPALTAAIIAVVIIAFLGLLGGSYVDPNTGLTRQNSDFPNEVGGVFGLAIGYGAFLAELFRAGIQSIGKGQMEAARSLGMTYVQAMRQVILPQAFRVVLPPLGNDFIALLKDSSLITILAIAEMTQRARIFAADTIRPFEAYITIAVLYLVMTVTLSFVVRVVESRTALPK